MAEQMQELADRVIDAMKSYVGKRVGRTETELVDLVATLERRVAALERKQ